MTGSRMGIIVLAIDAAFIAWMAKAGGIKAIIALLIVASPTAYYIPRIVNSAVFDRFAQGTESHTFQERMEFWQAGLEYWASHPIQGCGGGCFANAIASKVQKTNVSHNTYVTILVETGIVGFALASAFWILLLRMILRLPRHERVLCFGLLAVWAVCSMSLTWEYHKDTWLIYGVILAEYAATQALQSRQAAGAVSKAAP